MLVISNEHHLEEMTVRAITAIRVINDISDNMLTGRVVT
jgi:hypothetical protein